MKQLVSRLERGRFAARASDISNARKLLGGQLVLGDMSLEVNDGSCFDKLSDMSRRQFVELHSLRWLDVLRRTEGLLPGAGDAWMDIFTNWSASAAAGNFSSVAWEPMLVEHRSVVLALSERSVDCLNVVVDNHIDALSRMLEGAKDASRRLRMLQVLLGLMSRGNRTLVELREAAVSVSNEVFDDSGYAIATDLLALAEASVGFREVLQSLDISSEHPVMNRVVSSEFWSHIVSPDGEVVPVGGAVPQKLPTFADQSVRYALTRGAEGSPPDSVRYVNSSGVISVRSGWGETEQDADGETHATMIIGPVRGRDAHRDPSRVSFSSQRRRWIIDPLSTEALDENGHSVVVVPSGRYRTNGHAELVQQYTDGQVDSFVVKNSLYENIRWHRHFVFARTANYLIVDDTIRASTQPDVYQQWIIAPDLHVEPSEQGYLLHDGSRTLSIAFSGAQLNEGVVDEIVDSESRRIAWRIRVPFVSSAGRIITLVSDVFDRAEFGVELSSPSGKEFTAGIVDRGIRERLVVTPESSAVVPFETDGKTAISRIIEKSAAGSLSEDEVLHQRIAIREAIRAVKADIHAAGGTCESRIRALAHLDQAGRDLRVAGFRDHGYVAALIDIASADMSDRIIGNPQVVNVRRSPLIQWTDVPLIQSDYAVPVFTTTNCQSLPDRSRDAFIWSVDMGQLVLSSYVRDGAGDVLTVYLHGATDRTQFSMPRYERLRSLSQMGLGPVMSFSDPCLDLDSRMILSWYLGTEDLNLHHKIALMVAKYAERRGIRNVLLVGNSGGAFAALQVASYLAGTRVAAFNPQIQIERYAPRLKRNAYWSLFGHTSAPVDSDLIRRIDIIENYRQINFHQNVFLTQNTGDDHHFQEHYQPFLRAYSNSVNSSMLESHLPYIGPGHRVPSAEEYLRLVRYIAGGPSGDWEFDGLRGTA